MQRLIVVTATYRNPSAAKALEEHNGKIVGTWETLRYGNRQDFVRGFDELLRTGGRAKSKLNCRR